MGLRALFFLLAGLLGRIYYLKIGLALVLGFVGVKMLVSEIYEIPITVSLAVIACLAGRNRVGLVRACLAFVAPTDLQPNF